MVCAYFPFPERRDKWRRRLCTRRLSVRGRAPDIATRYVNRERRENGSDAGRRCDQGRARAARFIGNRRNYIVVVGCR